MQGAHPGGPAGIPGAAGTAAGGQRSVLAHPPRSAGGCGCSGETERPTGAAESTAFSEGRVIAYRGEKAEKPAGKHVAFVIVGRMKASVNMGL